MSRGYPALAVCPGCGLVVKAAKDGRMRSHQRLALAAGKSIGQCPEMGLPVSTGTLGKPPAARPVEQLPAGDHTRTDPLYPGGSRFGIDPIVWTVPKG